MTTLPDLDVKILSREKSGLGEFQLLNDFAAVTEAAGTITVLKGYITDCASIPFFARWIIPQCGHSARAAVLHDWLLRSRDRRATAVFNEALKADGTGPVRRWLMVAFVWLWTYPDLHWLPQEAPPTGP